MNAKNSIPGRIIPHIEPHLTLITHTPRIPGNSVQNNSMLDLEVLRFWLLRRASHKLNLVKSTVSGECSHAQGGIFGDKGYFERKQNSY